MKSRRKIHTKQNQITLKFISRSTFFEHSSHKHLLNCINYYDTMITSTHGPCGDIPYVSNGPRYRNVYPIDRYQYFYEPIWVMRYRYYMYLWLTYLFSHGRIYLLGRLRSSNHVFCSIRLKVAFENVKSILYFFETLSVLFIQCAYNPVKQNIYLNNSKRKLNTIHKTISLVPI